MPTMLKKWTFCGVSVVLLVVALLLQSIAPVRFLVFCVGNDGHAGVEFAHKAGTCDTESDTACCENEKSGASHSGLECPDECCGPSHCSDTALPVYAAVLQTKAQTGKEVLLAEFPTPNCFLTIERVRHSQILRSPSSPPLMRSTVLRI